MLRLGHSYAPIHRRWVLLLLLIGYRVKRGDRLPIFRGAGFPQHLDRAAWAFGMCPLPSEIFLTDQEAFDRMDFILSPMPANHGMEKVNTVDI